MIVKSNVSVKITKRNSPQNGVGFVCVPAILCPDIILLLFLYICHTLLDCINIQILYHYDNETQYKTSANSLFSKTFFASVTKTKEDGDVVLNDNRIMARK